MRKTPFTGFRSVERAINSESTPTKPVKATAKPKPMGKASAAMPKKGC